MNHKTLLEALIADQLRHAPTDACPVVSLEDFFAGNAIEGSFVANIADASLSMFYQQLRAMHARAEVTKLSVIIESSGELEPEHPYSDKVLVEGIGLSESLIRAWWPEHLAPDTIAPLEACDLVLTVQPTRGAWVL